MTNPTTCRGCGEMSDSELDCGDNSCAYAVKRGGMRTNGGCRCLKDLPVEQRRRVQRYIHKLRSDLDAARAEGRREGIREAWPKARQIYSSGEGTQFYQWETAEDYLGSKK